MRKRASKDNGLFVAYVVNLVLNAEWLFISLISYGLYRWINFPSFFWKLFLGIWLIWTAIVTFVLSSLISAGNEPSKPTQNKNPYSSKTEDLYKNANNNITTDEKNNL